MPGIHHNKTVIVTGGAGSLGLAVVKNFLDEGANVVATDVQESLLSALPDEIEESHRSRLLPYKCNSADDTEVEKMLADIIEKFGRLDILINNAAINDKLEPTGDCSREMWDRNILVNMTGPFVTSQNAIKQFLKQELVGEQRGVILNVISAAGSFGGRAGVAYTASKHGLAGLTRSTAAFYGPKGIRCVAIMPGPMMTNMAKSSHDVSQLHSEGLALASATTRSAIGEPRNPESKCWHVGWSPLQQVAKTITVLCSDGMNTINGALVPTDMGWTVT